MKYLRLVFVFEGLDAVLYLGPMSAYWATLWLDVFRLEGIAVGTVAAPLLRARIVNPEELP